MHNSNQFPNVKESSISENVPQNWPKWNKLCLWPVFHETYPPNCKCKRCWRNACKYKDKYTLQIKFRNEKQTIGDEIQRYEGWTFRIYACYNYVKETCTQFNAITQFIYEHALGNWFGLICNEHTLKKKWTLSLFHICSTEHFNNEKKTNKSAFLRRCVGLKPNYKLTNLISASDVDFRKFRFASKNEVLFSHDC